MTEFLELYSTYSNKDLLKITSRPENFQADALNAAQHILGTREISEEDRGLAYSELLTEESRQNAIKSLNARLVAKISAFIKDLMMPSDEFDIRKWVFLVSIFLSVQYIWKSIQSIRYLIFFFNLKSETPNLYSPTQESIRLLRS